MDDERSIGGCSGVALESTTRDESGDATLEMTAEDAALGAVWLRVDGEKDSRRVCLAPGRELIFGTGEGVDVRLADRTVSARHVSVCHLGAVIEARDLGSRNGTRVGGARVARAWIGDGAAIDLGRVSVRVERGSASEEIDEIDEAIIPAIIGRSAPMRRLGGSIKRLAPLKLPALVRGESGTGKELVAKALHDASARAKGPFVAINAATISRDLAESELFGHQRGAFTGALKDRRGAFREAHKGTLFLDEIAALPLDLQAKLLRVVEEGLVRPLGAENMVPVDVRLVVATCEPLEQMIAARRFRADLYERLAVCVIHVPALRERTEDIELLCRHLLACSEIGKRDMSRSALATLRSYRWPGNVRELRNVIVQAALRSSGMIESHHIERVLAERSGGRGSLGPMDALRFVEEAGGNVSEAARRAQLPRSTLRDLVRAAGTRRMGERLVVRDEPLDQDRATRLRSCP